jgi:nucleoid-associated protein EbfC
LTNLAHAMRNVSQLSSQLKSLNARLEAARVFGRAASADHSVNVEMSGLGVVRIVSASPGLLAPENRELLEQLTKDSMNQAIKSAKELHVNAFKELTGGVELVPGLNEMLENMVK